jgi:uncharacterized protein YjiK
MFLWKGFSKLVFKIFIGCCFFLSACQMFWTPKSPRGYVLPRPKKMILEKKVNEISGLFYLQNENAMLAISDNKQKIYRITPTGEVSSYIEEDFGPQEDYEDVVRVDSSVYVLISDGTIVEINRTDSGLNVKNYPFWSKEKNDFETLYYDAAANSLVVLCKFCKEGGDVTDPNAYRFNLAGKRFDTIPYYTISSKEVMNILKDGQADLKPSAAAVHPREKRLYILSSAGHLLVVTDFKGGVQEVFRLNPTLYPQAEGIAFAPNGDLYISNEAKLGKPTLLHIPYKPSGKEKR